MTEQHPITPPPELVEQIRSDALRKSSDVLDYELRMIHAAYRAGADQELEACCEWLPSDLTINGESLRDVRRPKPPSLKEQALAILDDAHRGDLGDNEMAIIRCALEQLDD